MGIKKEELIANALQMPEKDRATIAENSLQVQTRIVRRIQKYYGKKKYNNGYLIQTMEKLTVFHGRMFEDV